MFNFLKKKKMETFNDDINIQQDSQDNDMSTGLMDKNDFGSATRPESRENRGFGHGHIVRQYMSGVGVITERYVSDDDMLFYESTGRSSDNDSTSIISDNSHNYLAAEEEKEEEEDETLNVPENCPCYEKALQDELKKNGFLKKIFRLILNFKSRLYKILLPM